MAQKIAIIGAGAFAREVLDVFDACNAAGADYDVLGYLVDPRYAAAGTVINDKPILGGLEWLRDRKDVKAICGVGAPEVRRRLIIESERYGATFCNVIHPRATITRWLRLGTGVIITAGCILTNQITLGDHVHVNLACTIGHDAVLEPYATLAPGVSVSGKVTIETGAYVGTGVDIIPERRIGAWSIVGAGAAVIRDIPPNTTAVGNPAKVISTRPAGWHSSGD